MSMPRPGILERTAVWTGAGLRRAESPPGLGVAVVYEDVQSREWATRLCDRVLQLVGSDALRMRSWSVHQLSDPTVLQEAVSAAIHSDVVVVAAYAARILPAELYSWVDGWANERSRPEGALIALLGVCRGRNSAADDAQEYLRVIARLSGLDFLLREQMVTPNKPALGR